MRIVRGEFTIRDRGIRYYLVSLVGLVEGKRCLAVSLITLARGKGIWWSGIPVRKGSDQDWIGRTETGKTIHSRVDHGRK